MRVVAVFLFVVSVAVVARGQQPAGPAIDPLHKPFDELLDVMVRDGFVYYNALRADRSRLSRYIQMLDTPAAVAHAKGSRHQQLALAINAYNAFVLQTVVNHFPIRGRAPDYPPNSIRQIPGAFDKQTFRLAGRSLTLDQIERDIIVPLGDARAVLALGRGAVGSGRLRSEAYDDERLDQQLNAAAGESVTRKEIVRVDVVGNQLSVSPIFSWREALFVRSFADKADPLFKQRSPIERAVLGLIQPHLLGSEAEFLEKNEFRMVYQPFDWRLNDLSNRPD